MTYKIYLIVSLSFYLLATSFLTAQEKVSKSETPIGDTIISSKTQIGDTANTVRLKLGSFLPPRNEKVYKPGRKWFFQLKVIDSKGKSLKSEKLKLKIEKESGVWSKGMWNVKKVGVLDNSSSLSLQLPNITQPDFINTISFSWEMFNFILTKREARGQGLRLNMPEYLEHKIAWTKAYKGQLIDTVYVKEYHHFEQQNCRSPGKKNAQLSCFKNFKTYETAVGTFTLNYWFDPINYGVLKVEIIDPDHKKLVLSLVKTNY